MKATVEEFKNILGGRHNKLAHVKSIIKGLRAVNLIATVHRRCMKTNPKIYFFVRINKSMWQEKWSDAYGWNDSYNEYVIALISSYFPDAYIVSARENGMLIAEFK